MSWGERERERRERERERERESGPWIFFHVAFSSFHTYFLTGPVLTSCASGLRLFYYHHIVLASVHLRLSLFASGCKLNFKPESTEGGHVISISGGSTPVPKIRDFLGFFFVIFNYCSHSLRDWLAYNECFGLSHLDNLSELWDHIDIHLRLIRDWINRNVDQSSLCNKCIHLFDRFQIPDHAATPMTTDQTPRL